MSSFDGHKILQFFAASNVGQEHSNARFRVQWKASVLHCLCFAILKPIACFKLKLQGYAIYQNLITLQTLLMLTF